MIRLVGQPDIDLDQDGLECLGDREGDGAIDVCCDGIAPRPCAPGPSCDLVEGTTCVDSVRIADGYSTALRFSAVNAEVIGIRAATSTVP